MSAWQAGGQQLTEGNEEQATVETVYPRVCGHRFSPDILLIRSPLPLCSCKCPFPDLSAFVSEFLHTILTTSINPFSMAPN